MSRYLVLVLDDELPEAREIGFEEQGGGMIASAGLSRAGVIAVITVKPKDQLERTLDAIIRAGVYPAKDPV